MPARDDGGPPGERLVAATFEDPHSLVWLLAPDGTVRRVGDAARSLVDESADAVVGQPFHATPWWDESTVVGHVERATDGEFVRFGATAAGSEVDVVLRPVTDDDDVEAVVAVAREAPAGADRRAKLAALHDVATRLESAADEAAVYDVTVRSATDVLAFSRCVVEVLEGEAVVPRAWTGGLDREAADAVDHGGWLADRVFDTGESVVVDDPADAPPDASAEGEDASWLAVPLDDAALLVAADATPAAFDDADRELADVLAAHAAGALRRVRHQERRRRQNERLEEFTSVVAHDLRNPLGAVRANLQVARELDDPDALDAIERSVDRMDELLADLLELASVGDAATELERVTLAETAVEAWETAAPADADLAVGPDVAFDADPSRLRQLLENLYDNALEHGDAVTVTVGAFDEAGFYVADDGPGIPDDCRDEVFEHGYTTSDDGTGFGLSIVQRIAETHGWTASITESETGGARFEFTGVEAAERDAD